MVDEPNKLTKLWNELKRRKVIGVIIAYVTVAVAIMYFAQFLENTFDLPPWFDKVITLILLIGFPIVVVLSWIFDVSSKGITKTELDEPISEKVKQPESDTIAPDKSIIVLPFENISSDSEQEYFSDGLTEEIITDLSYINDLLVISRSSAMTFKGTKKKIKEIAGEVNVRYVLEGSVRKSENDLRIVAQLIDSMNDSHIWAEKYNGSLEDIFDIQEKVSHSIAEALKLKLKPEEKISIEERPVENTNANEYYLKARYEIHRFTEDSLNRALVALENAVDIVGKNAQLYAEIGFAHFQFVNMGIKPEEHSEQAQKYANMAIQLEPENPWANVILAGFLYYEGKLKEAVKLTKTALRSNSNDPDLLFWASWLLMLTGNFSNIYPLIYKAINIDPLNPLQYMTKGATDFFNGQFNSAVEFCAKAHKMQPDNPMITFWYAISLAYADKKEDALSILDKHLILNQPNPDNFTQQALFLKLVLTGEKEKISELEGFFLNAKYDSQHSYHNACFYSYLNEKEAAFEWLDNSITKGFSNYPLLNEHDPFLENIRGEKRFTELMVKVKNEWENFEV